MNLITLDFETYFDADYTLSKLTTESYVRDPRFKVHCLGARQNKTFVVPLINKDDDFCGRLSNSAILCHHAQFDGLILSHHYGISPAFWFDTLSMARLVLPHLKSHSLGALAKHFGLPEKTVPYNLFKGMRDLPPDLYQRVAAGCVNDVELTYAIFKKLLPLVPAEELKMIDLTIRMFTEPCSTLDRPRMEVYLAKTKDAKEAALQAVGVTKKDLQSAEKFASLLRSLGVEPPMKESPTGKGPIYAFAKTDKEFVELGEDPPDTRVQALVAARLGSKSTIGETRAEGLLSMSTRGFLPVYLNYYGAKTARWSGGDGSNFQNLTRGSELRLSLMAPPGYVLAVADASQIECRLVNWLAGQHDVLDKFRNKEDIYSQLATQFYGEPVDKSKPAMRGTGKQIELSCGFRAGADSIKETARRGTYGPPVIMTDAQALAARDLYRTTHPCVVNLWRYCDKAILPSLLAGNDDFAWGPMRVYGQRIYLPNGAWIDYTNLKWSGGRELFGKPYADGFYVETRKGPKAMHGGIVTQNVIEGLARTILAQAMLQVKDTYKIVLCTHDEMVACVPAAQGAEAVEWMCNVLKTPPAWCPDLPLDAEGGFAINYSK